MAVDKAQGQSLSRVGVNMAEEVFSHGQLHVALSRTTSPREFKILLQKT